MALDKRRLWIRVSSQAFCAVVEREASPRRPSGSASPSPPSSLQVRALEKRLGTQLLDRSGRRVEPTEAGLRLYRGAQRLLRSRSRSSPRSPRRRPASSTAPSRSARRPGRAGSSSRSSSASSRTRTRSCTSRSGSSTRRRCRARRRPRASSSASSVPRRATAASCSSRSSATGRPRLPARPPRSPGELSTSTSSAARH